jgi:uroporphyrinogen-III synthase
VSAVRPASAEAPLSGLRVLVPRAREQAPELAGRIRDLGGEPLNAPTITIEAGDVRALDREIAALGRGEYVAVCFTSANAATAVADSLRRTATGVEVFEGVRVAAIGAGTAAALEGAVGIAPHVVPTRATTEALGEAFPPGSGRVLLPRADIATATLPAVLRDRGYEPVHVDAYVTTLPDALPTGVAEALAAGEVDLIPFTSSSTVRNFAALLAGRPWQGRVVSIGPVTSGTCRELGMEVAVEADRHDLDGLVDALILAACLD